MQNPSTLPGTPVRPEDVLADGQDATRVDGLNLRKGTIAAFLRNALHWTGDIADEAERAAFAQEIVAALPALKALGVFEVFAIRDPGLRELASRHGYP